MLMRNEPNKNKHKLKLNNQQWYENVIKRIGVMWKVLLVK